jgi:hypothetical protein
MAIRNNLNSLKCISVLSVCLVLIVLLSVNKVEAEFNFGGFGTLSMVDTDTSGHYPLIFVNEQPDFDRREKGPFLDQDTVLGLQVEQEFSSGVKVMVQATSWRKYDNSYRPELEWGYVQIPITDTSTFRLGRQPTPFGFQAQYRKVTYALPIVRVNPTFYNSLVPFQNLDLAQYRYDDSFDDLSINITASGGRTEAQTGFSSAKAETLYGFEIGGNYNDILSFYYSRMSAKYSIKGSQMDQLNQLLDLIRAPDVVARCPECPNFAKILLPQRTRNGFDTAAIQWTPSWGIAKVEWIDSRVKPEIFVDGHILDYSLSVPLPSYEPITVTLGYVFGRSDKSDTRNKVPNAPEAKIVDEILLSAYDRDDTLFNGEGYYAAIRYDLTPGVALKGQIDYWDHVSRQRYSPYTTNYPDNVWLAKTTFMWSASLDFVF